MISRIFSINQNMLTQTLKNPEPKQLWIQEIEKTVNERGFYLYEWISRDELRMTLERDYLQIVRWASIPLAVIAGIAWLIGFAGWPIGTVLAVFWVLWVFYLFVWCILTLRFLYRAYLYTRGANVVITDDHYVSWGRVFEKNEHQKIKDAFYTLENTFDEPFLGESALAERKQHAKKQLFENLKEIAFWWGKIIEKVGRSKDAWGIVVVLLIAWSLYGIMMAGVYFVGIFFIGLIGRLFSWWAHSYLLWTSNTEHTIQTLFSDLDVGSKNLQWECTTSLSLLSEAHENAWKDSLLTRINQSLENISAQASRTTDDSITLRNILESSEYKNIFNFSKYRNWTKKQILDPIESIITLLENNLALLTDTVTSLEWEIHQTKNTPLRNPLELQQQRLNIQISSFKRTLEVLRSYRERLV